MQILSSSLATLLECRGKRAGHRPALPPSTEHARFGTRRLPLPFYEYAILDFPPSLSMLVFRSAEAPTDIHSAGLCGTFE